MPRITKVCYGGFWLDAVGQKHLGAVATLGWGTRPLHTIKKLFPSLDTSDYYELGKLCLSDSLPRNSESWFLSRVIMLVRRDHPTLKLLFSWADGILGKPGYVYQASNFYYGGYIWTEMYLDKNGNRTHVRAIQGHPDLPQSSGHFKTRSFEAVEKLGFKKYFGLQFRYVYPFVTESEWWTLVAESPFEWSRGNYPKTRDCRWQRQASKGVREACERPVVSGTKYGEWRRQT